LRLRGWGRYRADRVARVSGLFHIFDITLDISLIAEHDGFDYGQVPFMEGFVDRIVLPIVLERAGPAEDRKRVELFLGGQAVQDLHFGRMFLVDLLDHRRFIHNFIKCYRGFISLDRHIVFPGDHIDEKRSRLFRKYGVRP
jgi:hypothetical protein